MREALEPLLSAYDAVASERQGRVVFFHRGVAVVRDLTFNDLTSDFSDRLIFERADSAETPVEARVRFVDPQRDYLASAVSARRLDRAAGGVLTFDAPLSLEAEAAERLAQAVLAERRAGMEALSLSLGPAHFDLEPGDCVTFAERADVFEVVRADDVASKRLELRRTTHGAAAGFSLAEPPPPPAITIAPRPALALLDLPPLPGAEADERPLAAVFAAPWLGDHLIFAADNSVRGVATQPSITGELEWPLWPGPVDRWDNGNRIRVKLYGGTLDSISRAALLNGGNAFAVESADGEWEIVQAQNCVLVAPSVYELSGFLRGRLGSAHAMRAPHPAGARVVMLNERLTRIGVKPHEWGEAMALRAPPSGSWPSDQRSVLATPVFARVAVRPWAPAHLRARRLSGGDLQLSWVRCARSGGDFWGAADPPLGAPSELYRLEVLDEGGIVRIADVPGSVFTYSAVQQAIDFVELPPSIRIRVAQIGADGRQGLNAELTITL